MSCEVVVYTKKSCPYCDMAKDLFDRKGVSYTMIDITDNSEAAAIMIEKSGGRKTVPQIFIGTTCVGGFDDLNRMNEEGLLDGLLFAGGK